MSEMSKPSKSQTQATNSSSVGSICPPTAQSPSMLTAEPLTDPRQIPTALSNSVNTAIGGTPSDFESNSGLSDTSAGSGRVNSNVSATNTAKSPTSPELIMNDLRRGSLFGRQSKSQGTYGPKSVTNITFSNNTNMSTASQLSSFDEKSGKSASEKSKKSKKSRKSGSTKTGIVMTGKKSGPRGQSAVSGGEKSRKRSPCGRITAMKKQQERQKEEEKRPDFSKKSLKKSTKSQKKLKSKMIEKNQDSGKSMKSGKSAKKPRAPPADQTVDADFSKKSKKSKKTVSSKKSEAPAFGKSGVIKKGDNNNNPANNSVYLPGVQNGPPPPPPPATNKFMNGRNNGQLSSSRKSNKNTQTQPYNFPGAGKCTRTMDQVMAPPTPKNNVPLMVPAVVDQNNSHCVYDVSQLPPAQRRLSSTSMPHARNPPKSLFGTRKMTTPSAPKSEKVFAPPKMTQTKEQPIGNKIVVLGTTPDGKTTIQMTIDMQIVAGEALKGSDKPVDVVPKKIMIGGKEFELDSKSKTDEMP